MAGVVALALLLAVRDVRSVLFDDAAITFRYAWRIAHGLGFTYNDGDRTNGASAPLYTLVLAALSRLGIDLETAARAVGAACYAVSCGLVAWLAHRLGGAAAAVLAAALLLASVQYRQLALSGMESAFAVVLGLLALCLLVQRRELAAGIVLGLAVVNKLDAGVLALAIAIAFLAVLRRPPLRLAVAATVVALPWFAFSTWYFGSPIPYSATQKATVVQNSTNDHDPLWILRDLGSDRALLLVVLAALALGLVPQLARRGPELAIAVVAAIGWGFGHLALFSLIDLGDPYPWYVTVVYPPVSIGAALTCAHLFEVARAAPGRARAWTAVALVVALALATTKAAQVVEAGRVVVAGHHVDAFESFEATRRDAGALVAELAEPGEVIATCFGWVAYQARSSPIDETCPLSTREPVDPPIWGVEALHPDLIPSGLPAGAEPVAVLGPRGEPPLQMVVYRFAPPDGADD